MKRYALYTYPGRAVERDWPQLGGEEFEQTCERLSDFYHHADDVAAALEANDREIEKLKEQFSTSERVLESSTKHIAELTARCRYLYARMQEEQDRLAAVRDRCESNNWMGTARLCDG